MESQKSTRKQLRRSFSVPPDYYKQVKEYCQEQGYPMGPFIHALGVLFFQDPDQYPQLRDVVASLARPGSVSVRTKRPKDITPPSSAEHLRINKDDDDEGGPPPSIITF